MGLSTRELYLVLRARDEASRTLRGVSREMLATSAAAAAASSRAAASLKREEAARLRNAAVMQRQYAAQLRATGATGAQVQAAEQMARSYENQSRAASGAAKQLENQARQAEAAARSHEHLINTIHQSGVALATIGVGLAAGGAIGIAGLALTIKTYQEYQRTVALTRTQVDGFQVSLKQLSDIGLNVAKNIGVAFDQIQPELYDIFSSTNANLKQATVLLTSFAKASVAGQVDMQAATRTTLSIMNAFHIPFEKVNDVLDIQFQLVRKGVGTYAQFAAVIGNTIPAAARAGQNFQTVAAMLAFMTRNGLSAAMASTSAARALEAMSNPKTVNRLKKMGIAFYDAHNQARPLADILQELRDKLMKLPAPDRVRALTDLLQGAGGTIQARRFLDQILLKPGSLEEFLGFLKDMNNASGQFEKAYGQMADTTANKTQLLKNQFKILSEQTGEALAPAFTKVVGYIADLLQKFNDLPSGTRNAIVAVAAVVSVLAVLSGIILVIVGGIAALIAAVMAAGSALAIVAGIAVLVVGGIAALGAAFYSAWQNSTFFRLIISEIIGILQEFWQVAVQVAQSVAAAYEKNLAPAIRKLRDVIENDVLPAVYSFIAAFDRDVMPKMREAGRIIGDIVGKAFQFVSWVITTLVIPAVKEASKWWQQHKADIEPILPILGQVVKWALIIAAVLTGVLAVALLGPVVAAFLAVGAVIIGVVVMITTLIGWVKSVVNWFKNAGSEAQGMGKKLKDAVSTAIGFFANLGATVRNAVGNLGSVLIKAGEQIIQGLMTGVNNMKNQLFGLLGSITAAIPFHKGPEDKDRRMLIPAGKAIMGGLIRGVASLRPTFNRMLDDIGKGVTVSVEGNVNDRPFVTHAPPGPGDGPGNNGVVKNYNITQNIYTQELNPTRQAAALGWEVQTML